MKKICIFLVRLYQKYISPLKKRPTCRFSPTCSSYAIQAFEEWGFFIGFALSFWRLLRCNPFCKSGFDPVPKRKRKKHKNSEDIDSPTSTQ